MRNKNNLTKPEEEKLIKTGRRIYKRIKSRLENKFKGKIIAIEVESGEYIIGDDELQVALKAKGKFPDKIFAFFRIGYPAVHKLRKG